MYTHWSVYSKCTFNQQRIHLKYIAGFNKMLYIAGEWREIKITLKFIGKHHEALHINQMEKWAIQLDSTLEFLTSLHVTQEQNCFFLLFSSKLNFIPWLLQEVLTFFESTALSWNRQNEMISMQHTSNAWHETVIIQLVFRSEKEYEHENTVKLCANCLKSFCMNVF